MVAAKLFKISSAICFGINVLAGLALLRDAQYVNIDRTLLLDLDDDGNSSKFGDLQAMSMVLAVAFLIFRLRRRPESEVKNGGPAPWLSPARRGNNN